jgi:NitT/TauT family transport system substrate-binding protein
MDGRSRKKDVGFRMKEEQTMTKRCLHNNRILSMAVFILLTLAISLPAANAAEERLNYRLKWLFNTSVAGDLYADVHGIFTAHGLNITVKAGGPERDAIKELELGHAQFGVASADQVIRARAKGAPVVVIAQLFQVNPLQWIYRSKRLSIDTLNDLRGRNVGITYGGNDETIMRTLMAKGKLTEKDLILHSVRYDYTPFFKGEVEIWPVYRNSQGIFIAQKLADSGEEVGFLDPNRFGVKFVANSVVTSERMMAEKPKEVERFATALLQAWEEAMDPANNQKTIATIASFDKDSTRETIQKQLDITRRLVKPTAKLAIGTIDVEGWHQTEAIMLEQKQIDAPVEIERYLIGID